MTSVSDADPRIIDIGPPDWCWSRLTATHEGTLSSRSPHGRLVAVVPYAVTEQQIRVPIAACPEAVWFRGGLETTLEVSGHDPGGLRWVVRATGLAVRGPEQTLLAGRHGRPGRPGTRQGWHPSVPSDRLMLVSVRVRGFYETSLAPSPDVVG